MGIKGNFIAWKKIWKIHEYSLIRGSCHTPSDGSQKYPDLWKKLSCCTKTPNEDWHKQKNLLIGMQDLTPNKLFGCTATSSNTREKPRNKKSKKKKVLNLKKLLQSVHKMGDVTAGTDWQAPIGVAALWDAKLWLINTLATPSMLALLGLVLVVNKVWGWYWLVLFLAKLLFFTTIASELAVS